MKFKEHKQYRWVILIMLVLTWTMTFFSRFVWSPVIQSAAGDLGMTMSEAGSLMSAFYLGYLITQVPGGFIADRYRPKIFMVIFTALVGVLTYGMSMVNGYTAAYTVRILAGLTAGPIMAFCSKILTENFAPNERSLAFGIFFASSSLGTLLANLLAPSILVAYDWRTVFRVAAILIEVIMVLDVVLVPNPERPPVLAADQPKLIEGFKNYFSKKEAVIISVAGFLFMAIPAGFSTWANNFMTSTSAGAGLAAAQAGMVMTVYAIFSVIGSIASGALSKKYKWNPKYYVIIIFSAMTIFLLAWSRCMNMGALIAVGVVFGLVSCAASNQLTTWVVNACGSKYSGTTSAIQNLLFQLSNIIFPTLAGGIIDKATVDGVVTSYSGVWFMYASMMFVAAGVMFLTSAKSAADSIK